MNDRSGAGILPGMSRGEPDRLVLLYGSASLASVVPDVEHPSMWRIQWADGSLSDMANLARAKDAALALCERGPPAGNRTSLHWRLKPSNSPPRARTARKAEGVAV